MTIWYKVSINKKRYVDGINKQKKLFQYMKRYKCVLVYVLVYGIFWYADSIHIYWNLRSQQYLFWYKTLYSFFGLVYRSYTKIFVLRFVYRNFWFRIFSMTFVYQPNTNSHLYRFIYRKTLFFVHKYQTIPFYLTYTHRIPFLEIFNVFLLTWIVILIETN